MYRFYIPELIRLANDAEENPGPSLPDDDNVNKIVGKGLKRRFENQEKGAQSG